ncbi:hypothetical protein [Rubrivirga sp. IMCC43871]|uniref:hypothetical protein n=1 Tax=Rubrivirga sp. IMCC43871 TaxID=3391575 RepID=UPI00398FA2F5
MTDRDAALLALRPTIPTEPADTPAEAFLHRTLRPVLKLQNDALLAVVADTIRRQVPGFAGFDPADQRARLAQRMKQDARLGRVVLGLVLGVLTADERAFALANGAEVRRRIAGLAAERVVSQTAAVAALAS